MAEPRILLVRFSAIGDCVMAAWTATALRNAMPNAFLCWAVETRCEAVIDRQALCSRVCEFPRDRWKQRRWSPATWRDQLASYARLRNLHFDLGFDLQGHSKTALCLRIATPQRRIAASATDGLAARLNPLAPASPDGTHTVERNLAVIQQLVDVALPPRPIMPARKGEPDAQLVTISVAAGQPNKAWPHERWESVARHLVSVGYDVHFLGGTTDAAIHLAGTHDHVGKLPLGQTLDMVARSRLHLAADTGTGHMAAAYGVPVVSVFGPTDPARFRPYTTGGTVLKHGDETRLVSVDEVIRAAEERLAIPD